MKRSIRKEIVTVPCARDQASWLVKLGRKGENSRRNRSRIEYEIEL